MNYNNKPRIAINRIQLLKAILIIVGIVMVARLFYVQIVHHDYYQSEALAEHLKKFEIPATRGMISFEDGNATVPVVLNQPMYTIYADPTYISNAKNTADQLTKLLGVAAQGLQTKLETQDTEYVVLAKKVPASQANKINALRLNGIGEQEISSRDYPEGSLAAQLLGFVNDNGAGQYGIEGALNSQLAGKAGLEKAVTDERGVPLAINSSNVEIAPVNGKNVTLTIDLGMQSMIENVLKQGVETTKSVRGTAILMEANTGAIKAMANYPTYNPSQYSAVTDQSLFTNNAVSYPYEPGSVMKPLLLGAAFTEGTATPQTSFFDPNYVIVDGQRINNSEYWAPQTESLQEVINKSLNTGAVFILKTLGGGQIDEKARTTWYDYLSQHYFFGQNTGIQQTDEQPGILYGPDSGSGIDFRYANMAFGQGITVTPLQLITAYCAILNGGTYYKPSLIANTDSNGNLLPFKPTVVARNVISAEASSEIRSMLEISLNYNNSAAERAGYDIGAKSGTAQIAGPNGSYLPNVYIGTYIGFIAGAGGVQYVMMVRLDQPVITSANTFASGLAAKVWTQMEKNLLNNYAIQPNNP